MNLKNFYNEIYTYFLFLLFLTHVVDDARVGQGPRPIVPSVFCVLRVTDSSVFQN